MVSPLQKSLVTGLILAGGRSSRMGGLDKGQHLLGGQTLACHVLRRLRPQVSAVAVSTSHHADAYARLASDLQIWPDPTDLPGYSGPLAGMLSGLDHCTTEFLLTVPCDSPYLPLDLLERLSIELHSSAAHIAVAADRSSGEVHWHPVFCLMHRTVRAALREFMRDDGRKIVQWLQTQGAAVAVFDRPGDDPQAFANINTREQLLALEALRNA